MTAKMSGRRLLVTGGASGMGYGIATRFVAEGAAVALLDVNAEGVRAAAESLGVPGFACDVGDASRVEAAVVQASAALGGLDGVVNAAGILITRDFDQLSPEEWDRMIRVNLTGPFNVIRAALPELRKAERATIVNIASVSGVMPMRGTAGYSATKAGLIMLTKGLALELGPNIRVNTILPGVVRTEMTRHIWENPEHRDRAAERTALKRLGLPEDIAEAALFLTTDASAFSTGMEIIVDGGFSWR